MQDRKPKVYFIACSFPPFGRGNSITNACAANHLAQYFDIEVICKERENGLLINYEGDDSLVRDLVDGLVVHRLRSGRWSGAVNEVLYALGILPCYYLNWAWRVVRRGSELIGDRGVIFAVYPVFSDLVVGWYLSRHHKCPLVLDFRDDFSAVMSRGWRRVLAPVYRWMESRLLRSAQRVTVTTDHLKDALVLRHGLDEGRVSVVHNIVPKSDRRRRRPISSDEGDVKVVYAGAISAIQRPEILLRAYRKLCDSRPDLGRRVSIEFYGPESPYFRLKVKQHFVEGCHYHGFVPHDELIERLREIDIGFFSLADPIFAYATPTKLFEYVELGIPVLAALPPGEARRMIEENDIGMVANPGDIDGLAGHLAHLVEQPDQRRRLEVNVELMRDRFPPEQEAQKWRDAIREAGAVNFDTAA